MIVAESSGYRFWLSRRLKSVIKAAGKRSYTFAVGKINVPKLANFADIDAFVVVACEVRIQRTRAFWLRSSQLWLGCLCR